MTTIASPGRLYFAGDEVADRLLAREPLALLIGFTLDQQVALQKAFSGPLELERRLGAKLDAGRIAAMAPDDLAAAFRQRPALHRFPGAMAARVQALCATVAGTYGNDASRIWLEARNGPDLRARLLALPGVGELKAGIIVAVLAKRFALGLEGLDQVVPRHPTLGDVDSPEALAAYLAGKRAHKAAVRAGLSPDEAGRAAMEAMAAIETGDPG